jgi:hypothetical protein
MRENIALSGKTWLAQRHALLDSGKHSPVWKIQTFTTANTSPPWAACGA